MHSEYGWARLTNEYKRGVDDFGAFYQVSRCAGFRQIHKPDDIGT